MEMFNEYFPSCAVETDAPCEQNGTVFWDVTSCSPVESAKFYRNISELLSDYIEEYST
jgi:hypothetical protein